MQYLVSVIHDSAELATPEEMAAIDAFNDRLHGGGSLGLRGRPRIDQLGHRHRQPGWRGDDH